MRLFCDFAFESEGQPYPCGWHEIPSEQALLALRPAVTAAGGWLIQALEPISSPRLEAGDIAALEERKVFCLIDVTSYRTADGDPNPPKARPWLFTGEHVAKMPDSGLPLAEAFLHHLRSYPGMDAEANFPRRTVQIPRAYSEPRWRPYQQKVAGGPKPDITLNNRHERFERESNHIIYHAAFWWFLAALASGKLTAEGRRDRFSNASDAIPADLWADASLWLDWKRSALWAGDPRKGGTPGFSAITISPAGREAEERTCPSPAEMVPANAPEKPVVATSNKYQVNITDCLISLIKEGKLTEKILRTETDAGFSRRIAATYGYEKAESIARNIRLLRKGKVKDGDGKVILIPD